MLCRTQKNRMEKRNDGNKTMNVEKVRMKHSFTRARHRLLELQMVFTLGKKMKGGGFA